MHRKTQEKEAATAVGRVPRAMTVAVMILSIANGGAFRPHHGIVRSCSARTRLLSPPPALADRVLSPQEYATATVARPAVEAARPENNEAESVSFFERIGRPRYVAAPMVEQSEAAFRILVKRHGCDLAYTQMLHAAKFAPESAVKFRDGRFDAVDAQADRPLIAQFCGNDPDTVVRAARHVEGRCDGVDLNLGCPQKIAKKGNYGAFLLSDPQLCEDIVSAMSRELSVPVTVKIRAQENESDTLELARRLEGAGAQLLTVHGRTVSSKKTTQGAANWDIIRKVKDAVSIPVVANGGIETGADAERLLEETGADAVMSSEGLLENPALFDRTIKPMEELQGVEVAHRILSLTVEYMELVKQHPAPMISIKGHLFKMLYRLLECHHDLRGRLAHWQCDAVEAEAIVREMCQRYFFDPDTRMPSDGPLDTSDLRVSLKPWYRRHRKDEIA
ncbi:unnamed protein product [Pylaiella littoralis]